MKNKYGFTLSEVMVTLGVLGVLAAILIPAVTKVSPDTSRIMFKKAYFTTEKVVSSLISDDSLYPIEGNETTDTNGATVYKGFNDTASGSGTVFVAGNDKFCYLFSQRLNTVSSNCTAGAVSGVPAYTFTTSDGIVWTYTVSTFAVSPTAYETVDVLSADVNGSKNPNCFYNATTCTTPDQFKFRIRYDGKMTVDPTDAKAIEYLTNPTVNKK